MLVCSFSFFAICKVVEILIEFYIFNGCLIQQNILKHLVKQCYLTVIFHAEIRIETRKGLVKEVSVSKNVRRIEGQVDLRKKFLSLRVCVTGQSFQGHW